LPPFKTPSGSWALHFSKNPLSSDASLRSSGSIRGIVSMMGYHLPHLPQSRIALVYLLPLCEDDEFERVVLANRAS